LEPQPITGPEGSTAAVILADSGLKDYIVRIYKTTGVSLFSVKLVVLLR
jgi:hypothetical protein